jgi:hypothetical protein
MRTNFGGTTAEIFREHSDSLVNIHYHKNQFTYERIEKSNEAFKGGPDAGYRAPDAPVDASSLFILLAQKPFNILFFQAKKGPVDSNVGKINLLIKNYKNWVQVHFFVLSGANKLLFKRYGVISSAIYVIRPDGYVGFRLNGDNYLILEEYLKKILNRPAIKEV